MMIMIILVVMMLVMIVMIVPISIANSDASIFCCVKKKYI